MQPLNFISGRSGSSSPCSDEHEHRQLSARSAFQSKAQRQRRKSAFLPFLNSAIHWEFPEREEQQHHLFTGREMMKKRSVKYVFN